MAALLAHGTPSILLLALALLGLIFAILSDHLQIVAKYQGAMRQKIAGGYNLAMKIMVLNRIGAALYFLIIAFNIDRGLSARTLTLGLSTAILFVSVPTTYILIFLQKRVNRVMSDVQIFDHSMWPKGILLAVFLATSCNLLGLTVPWIAGAAYPQLRLTLSNTSVLFNAVFTAVNVFYIEHKFAALVDEGNQDLHGFVAGVMIARLAAFLVVGSLIGMAGGLAQ